MDRHSELQQHMTAAEYRQAADEHVRTLKDFWKDFLVSGLFVLAAIVAIFACLAWFAANNRVSATGSTIGAKAGRYTLTAAGEGESGAHVGYYERTDAEKQNITRLDTTDAMTVTLESNLNNESAGSLYPGARGKITFTVKPLVSDLDGVTINLSRLLKVTNIVGVVGDGGTLAPEAEALLGLIKGHVLFFTSCENGYYSGRVTNSQITIPKSSFCEGGNEAKPTNQSVPVTLYWVWPEYFQNFVLTGNTNYYKNLFAAAGDAKSDYGALQADMNEHKANYFYGAANGTSAVNAPLVSSSMSFSDTAICSALYNNADEQIGNKVKYIQLRISAQEGVSS
ncbi:hypothetical protein [Collinsella sp. wc0583]|jgi:hypothetical protein|uniref:hypothetical protein n=1 Tax=Collinsella sp. wc0583 TaxID=3385507 RepID=UPI0038F797A3